MYELMLRLLAFNPRLLPCSLLIIRKAFVANAQKDMIASSRIT